jgi:trans-aconitate methyltransferase
VSIKYWAIATWNGQQWDVRIEDYDERHRGDTQADNLELVTKNASAILAFEFGCHPDHLTLGREIRLPAPVAEALDAAEGFIASAAACLCGANTALRQAGVPEADIATLLAERKLDATTAGHPA